MKTNLTIPFVNCIHQHLNATKHVPQNDNDVVTSYMLAVRIYTLKCICNNNAKKFIFYALSSSFVSRSLQFYLLTHLIFARTQKESHIYWTVYICFDRFDNKNTENIFIYIKCNYHWRGEEKFAITLNIKKSAATGSKKSKAKPARKIKIKKIGNNAGSFFSAMCIVICIIENYILDVMMISCKTVWNQW